MTVNRMLCTACMAAALVLSSVPSALAVPPGEVPHEAPTSTRIQRSQAAPAAAPASAIDAVVVGQCGTPAAPGCAAPPVAAPPPPAPAPAPAVRPIYPRKGMMITGWVMLGASWLLGSLIGAVEADVCDVTANSRCKALATSLFIPVVGPFVAISYSNSYSEKWGLGILGASEAVGLILGIIGTIQHVADKRAAARQRGLALGGGWRLHVGAASPVSPAHLPTPTLVVGTQLW